MKISFVQRCIRVVVGLLLIAASVWMGILMWQGDHVMFYIVAIPTTVVLAMIDLYEGYQSRKIAKANVEPDVRSEE